MDYLVPTAGRMPKRIEAEVVVVGAGPVGLTLTLDLAQRGNRVCVIELREAGEPPSVKCNHVSARSMEIFRRLGVAQDIRCAGLPEDFPHDIAFRTTMTGPELARVSIPSRGRRFTAKEGPDTGWPTPEPPHRINQIYMEPILFEAVVSHPNVSVLNRFEYERFEQDRSNVRAFARSLDSDEPVEIDSAYLIGCDGGQSRVRKQIGSRLSGDAVIQRVQSTYIHAPSLIRRLTTELSWGSLSLNPRRSGTVYAIDGVENWLVHNYLREEEADFDAVDRDWAIRQILGVGPDFEYDVISREDWYGRRLLADRFRERRVFICGDAAHLWVPFAGYGMNAGLADAENLAWLVSARLKGWGGERILDAYEAERHPITEQVSYFAMNHAFSTARQRRAVPPEIEDATPEGLAARAALGASTYALNVQQYACAGLNFGYYYDDSPIIAYDDGEYPPYSMAEFTPSTVPGCRTPHVWLRDGSSLYDQLGPEFTMIRVGSREPVDDVVESARRRGIRLDIVDLPDECASDIYDRTFVLSRPDRHVAWRGNRAPKDTDHLLDLVTGSDESG